GGGDRLILIGRRTKHGGFTAGRGRLTTALESASGRRSTGSDRQIRRSAYRDSPTVRSICSASLRVEISTGSQTGENGGAYDRSMLTISSTLMPFQSAVANTSMRLAAPSLPTIWAPSSRPERRSASTLVRMGAAPGKEAARGGAAGAG